MLTPPTVLVILNSYVLNGHFRLSSNLKIKKHQTTAWMKLNEREDFVSEGSSPPDADSSSSALLNIRTQREYDYVRL